MTDRTGELVEQHELVLGGRKVTMDNIVEVVNALELARIIDDGKINGLQETVWELQEKIEKLESEVQNLKFTDMYLR